MQVWPKACQHRWLPATGNVDRSALESHALFTYLKQLVVRGLFLQLFALLNGFLKCRAGLIVAHGSKCRYRGLIGRVCKAFEFGTGVKGGKSRGGNEVESCFDGEVCSKGFMTAGCGQVELAGVVGGFGGAVTWDALPVELCTRVWRGKATARCLRMMRIDRHANGTNTGTRSTRISGNCAKYNYLRY